MARRRPIEHPHAPDLPEMFDPAPAELRSGAAWDSVEATEDSTVPEWAADVTLHDTRWVRGDLVGRRLSGLRCRNVEFVNCDLSGAVLAEAQLTRVVFDSCRTSGLVLSGATLQDIRFVDCKADGIDFRMAQVRRSAAETCSMREADFYRADLAEVRLVDSDLVNATFDEVTIDGLALNGSTVEGVRGAASLAGAEIDEGQILTIGALLVSALRFRVTPSAVG